MSGENDDCISRPDTRPVPPNLSIYSLLNWPQCSIQNMSLKDEVLQLLIAGNERGLDNVTLTQREELETVFEPAAVDGGVVFKPSSDSQR